MSTLNYCLQYHDTETFDFLTILRRKLNRNTAVTKLGLGIVTCEETVAR